MTRLNAYIFTSKQIKENFPEETCQALDINFLKIKLNDHSLSMLETLVITFSLLDIHLLGRKS